MKCPSCGREVRSKTQCAYCGHVFNGKKIKQTKNNLKNDESIITKKQSHQNKIKEEKPVEIGSREAIQERQVRPKVKNEKTNTEEFVTRPVPTSPKPKETKKVREKTPKKVIPKTKKKRSSLLWGILKLLLAVAAVFLLFFYGQEYIGKAFDFITNKTENVINPSSSEQESTTEEEGKVKLLTNKVNVDKYPMIQVDLGFDYDMRDITRDELAFVIDQEGENTELTAYSLIVEGKSVKLAFDDPKVGTKSTEPQKLHIKSEKLKLDETVEIKIPEIQADAKTNEKVAKAIKDKFNGFEDASVVAVMADQQIPVVNNNKEQNASSLISWFILQRTYQSIKDKELTMEQEIKIDKALKAKSDQGTIAALEDGSTISVQGLIEAVIQNQDVSAMNHLIQATGGPNKMNAWLSQSNYFSTRITSALAISDKEGITGALTSAGDVAKLLKALANNQLISENTDIQLKEALLKTPPTEKFPAELNANFTSWLEIASPDNLEGLQYYSSILEAQGKSYIVVAMAPKAGQGQLNDFKEAIKGILNTYLGNEKEESTSENDQISVVDESETANEDNQAGQPEATNDSIRDPNVQPAPVWDVFDDDGDGVPETERQGNWYFDNSSGQWYYN